jgi:hypothetical protein
MPRLTPVPYDEMDEELRAMAKTSDEALGGSQWLQYFAHAPDLHKELSAFYGNFILAERNGIRSRTIELVRRKVAEWNECRL